MVQIRTRLSGLMAALALFVCGTASAYQNPARGVESMGNPSVLRHEGVYYLYATANVHKNGANLGFLCWSSTDMMNWTARGWAYLPSSGDWSQANLWAPKVYHRNGVFTMYYTACEAPGAPQRICAAQSTSPLGPFTEVRAPLFVPAGNTQQIDPFLLADTDGNHYLYWVTVDPAARTNSISGQRFNPDSFTFLGSPVHNLVGTPYSAWEIASYGSHTVSIAEAPFVHKRNGIYYMLYAGNSYELAGYATGYATSTSPLGPFVRYAGNPILKSDYSVSPSTVGPATGELVPSPDGTELFLVYAAQTDPNDLSGDKSLYMDRVVFDAQGVLQVAGPTRTCQPDPSTGGPDSVPPTTCPDGYIGSGTDPITTETGWVKMGSQAPGLAWTGFDPVRSSIVAHVTPDPVLVRRTGVYSDQSTVLPYSEIGPDRYVRAKFAIYRANQANPNDPNQVPNFTIRAATRFAHSSLLEVFHHLVADKSANRALHETMPSADPERPSVYTVDFDPLDVPALVNTPGEGVMRAFEAYCIEPQENGEIALAESSIGTYPVSALPDLDTTDVLKKVYAPGLNDAGDLRSYAPGADQRSLVFIQSIFEGFPHLSDTTDTSPPLYFEAGLNSTTHAPGVTLDTSNIPPNRVGVATREFFPGDDPTAPNYVRIEPGRQYKIRWHLTSTRPANRQAMIRLRTRTLKWGWSHKTEIGGAYAAGPTNNLIAQQSLPGVGTMNPDQRTPGENGGWYTTLFHVPLDPAIRPEFPSDAPLAVRMPLLTSQPGPGENAYSLLDLKFGMDIIDTLSVGADNELEQGQVILDRIEVRSYPRVAD